MKFPPTPYSIISHLFVVLSILLTVLNGFCEPPSGGSEAQGDQRNPPQDWIQAGQVVDPDNPAWKQLQTELGQGFEQALESGLRALTNDLPEARRSFALAAREAQGVSQRAREQAQWGMDYVDALVALQQTSTLEEFRSSWVKVQETEAVLPDSWPRVGTNVAVQVVQARARKALDQARREEALQPLDAELTGLEVVVGLRKPAEDLMDPVTDRPAVPLASGVDRQPYFKVMDRLQRDFESHDALTVERRRLLQQVQRRLQLFPGAY